VKSFNSRDAIARLTSQFEERGWQDQEGAALAIIKEVGAKHSIDITSLRRIPSRTFLTKNRTTRSAVADAIRVALDDYSFARADSSAATDRECDVFISHAFEDKDEVARPLYEALKARGRRVWLDEAELTLGDSLRQSIDKGLARCRYGVVILSPSFLGKVWPQRELDGLIAREVASGEKAVLPIWHEIEADEVARHSPLLAGRIAVRTADGLDRMVEAIERVLRS